ncbi:hypothetical protein F5X99DRAFT_410143 [Biscogniauxia marginata]|nr:hypothetical protein F5X99DRAFT_410143 [Biscogniauxia marginata]
MVSTPHPKRFKDLHCRRGPRGPWRRCRTSEKGHNVGVFIVGLRPQRNGQRDPTLAELHAHPQHYGLGDRSDANGGPAAAKTGLDALRLDDIPKALRVFETIRQKRVVTIRKASLYNLCMFDLPDGEEYRWRDKAMRKSEDVGVSSPNLWSTGKFSAWLSGYNALTHGKTVPDKTCLSPEIPTSGPPAMTVEIPTGTTML